MSVSGRESASSVDGNSAHLEDSVDAMREILLPQQNCQGERDRGGGGEQGRRGLRDTMQVVPEVENDSNGGI